MNTKTSIFKQRLAAFLLLVVFMAVQLIKTLHTHESGFSNRPAEKTAFSTVTHPCPICDYDFAKDKDHVHQSFQLNIPERYFPEVIQHSTKLITSAGATASGRGPPTS